MSYLFDTLQLAVVRTPVLGSRTVALASLQKYAILIEKHFATINISLSSPAIYVNMQIFSDETIFTRSLDNICTVSFEHTRLQCLMKISLLYIQLNLERSTKMQHSDTSCLTLGLASSLIFSISSRESMSRYRTMCGLSHSSSSFMGLSRRRGFLLPFWQRQNKRLRLASFQKIETKCLVNVSFFINIVSRNSRIKTFKINHSHLVNLE